MDSDSDNPVFFDHGGLPAIENGKNQLPVTANIQQEFKQEVSHI